MQTQCVSVLARSKEGDKWRVSGSSGGPVDGTSVVTMKYQFRMPLSNISDFDIGTRPIRIMEWKNVVLPKN
jgi:hypothetical protein